SGAEAPDLDRRGREDVRGERVDEPFVGGHELWPAVVIQVDQPPAVVAPVVERRPVTVRGAVPAQDQGDRTAVRTACEQVDEDLRFAAVEVAYRDVDRSTAGAVGTDEPLDRYVEHPPARADDREADLLVEEVALGIGDGGVHGPAAR